MVMLLRGCLAGAEFRGSAAIRVASRVSPSKNHIPPLRSPPTAFRAEHLSSGTGADEKHARAFSVPRARP